MMVLMLVPGPAAATGYTATWCKGNWQSAYGQHTAGGGYNVFVHSAGADFADIGNLTPDNQVGSWSNGDTLTVSTCFWLEDYNAGPGQDTIQVTVTATDNWGNRNSGVQSYTFGASATNLAYTPNMVFGPWTVSCTGGSCGGTWSDAWTVVVKVELLYSNCGFGGFTCTDYDGVAGPPFGDINSGSTAL